MLLGGARERESKGQNFRAGGKTKRESDYSSRSNSPSSEHFSKNLFVKITVYRGCATSADLHMPFHFTPRTHE